MPTSETRTFVTSNIVATTSYTGVRTPTLDASRIDQSGIGIKVSADASCTGITYKVQTKVGGVWMELYYAVNGIYVLEEYTIPLSPNVVDQLRAFRMSGTGLREMRLEFKGVGGVATIKTIDLVAEQEHIKS